MHPEKSLLVNVTAIHDIKTIGFNPKVIQSVYIVNRSIREENKLRNISSKSICVYSLIPAFALRNIA